MRNCKGFVPLLIMTYRELYVSVIVDRLISLQFPYVEVRERSRSKRTTNSFHGYPSIVGPYPFLETVVISWVLTRYRLRDILINSQLE